MKQQNYHRSNSLTNSTKLRRRRLLLVVVMAAACFFAITFFFIASAPAKSSSINNNDANDASIKGAASGSINSDTIHHVALLGSDSEENPPLSVQDAKAKEAAMTSSTTSTLALNEAANGFGDDGNHELAKLAAHVTTLTKGQVRHLWYKTQWTHFFIAINLSNNEALVKDITRRLLAFLRVFVFPFFPPNHIIVSIFSNGNKDGTSEVIERVMEAQLGHLGIGLRIVPNGTCCASKDGGGSGGDDDDDDDEGVNSSGEGEPGYNRQSFNRRPKDIDRIEWMAGIRNAALLPLLQDGPAGVFAPHRRASARSNKKKKDKLLEEEQQVLKDNVHGQQQHQQQQHGKTSAKGKKEKDKVKKQSGPATSTTRTRTRTRTSLFNRSRHFYPASVLPLSNANVAVVFLNDIIFFPHDIFRLLTMKSGDFDMVCGLDFYYTFYDTWVTRDLSGRRFTAYPPFAPDFATQAAFNAGKPAQVKCCWNGMVVIRGSSFEKRAIIDEAETTRAGADFDVPSDDGYDGALVVADENQPTKAKQVVLPQRRDEFAEQAKKAMKAATPQKADERPHLGGLADLSFGNRRFLAFRYNITPTRCYSSECQLFCEDLHESGRHKIYINPNVKVAYEPYYFNLHHFNWLSTSGFLFSLAEWLRVWTWPAIIGNDMAAVKPKHADSQGMECVDPEETVNFTSQDFLLYGIAALVFILLLRKCCCRNRAAPKYPTYSSDEPISPSLKHSKSSSNNNTATSKANSSSSQRSSGRLLTKKRAIVALLVALFVALLVLREQGNEMLNQSADALSKL